MPSGLSPDSTQACGPAKKPIQTTPSSDNLRLTEASSTATGVSEKASELLLAGWSAGTNAANQSGWADEIAGVVNGKLIPFHAASRLS